MVRLSFRVKGEVVRSSGPEFYSKIVSELKMIDVRNARAEKTVETVQDSAARGHLAEAR